MNEKDLKLLVGKYLLGLLNISNEEHELTNNNELLELVVRSIKLCRPEEKITKHHKVSSLLFISLLIWKKRVIKNVRNIPRLIIFKLSGSPIA